jgi:hypothetical protein
MNENRTSEQTRESEEDDIPEMELSGGVRGNYYEAYQKGTNVVLLEPTWPPSFVTPPPSIRH